MVKGTKLYLGTQYGIHRILTILFHHLSNANIMQLCIKLSSTIYIAIYTNRIHNCIVNHQYSVPTIYQRVNRTSIFE